MNKDTLAVVLAGKEESVPVDSLVSVLENLVGILKEVAGTSEGHAPKLDWQIKDASLNSPLSISIGPGQDNYGDGRWVMNAVAAGMRQIEKSAITIPQHFTYRALERAKKLVAVLNDDIARLTLVPAEGAAIVLTQRVAAHVDELLPAPHDEIGTFEGRMETLSIHEGNIFAIWDVITGIRIECRVPEARLSEAHAAFGKRVAVSGRIHYSSDGRPQSMRVAELEVFPEREALPQFDDLVGAKSA